jgi:hypothetical protein
MLSVMVPREPSFKSLGLPPSHPESAPACGTHQGAQERLSVAGIDDGPWTEGRLSRDWSAARIASVAMENLLGTTVDQGVHRLNAAEPRHTTPTRV